MKQSPILPVLGTLALAEVRLRMRRLGTMVALLAVIALTWLMIPDPLAGRALLTAGRAQVLYTSSALALGSALMASLFLGLGGFFLLRGRMAEDVRSGIGGAIGASAIGNGMFLLGRWLGAATYLALLSLALGATMLVLHALRGVGPVDFLVYGQTFCLVLLPMLFFTASCAILFDSVPALMGKGGDAVYVTIWFGSFMLLTIKPGAGTEALPLLMAFDFSGIAGAKWAMITHMHVPDIAFGSHPFDTALPALTLLDAVWDGRALLVRLASAALALLPLWLAVPLFHRYGSDQVRPSTARARRSPMALADHLLRPVGRLAQALFRLALVWPGRGGQLLADVALTMAAAPSAWLALCAALLTQALLDASALPMAMAAAAAFWGVLVSGLSTRDHQCAGESMTAVVPGGAGRRYLRQWSVAVVLGLAFTGVGALRWLAHEPVRGLVLLSGLLSLSALATLFGRCARTPRMFIVLFLFWMYVALNAPSLAQLDVLGFNGVATVAGALAQLGVAAGALLAGYLYNRRLAR